MVTKACIVSIASPAGIRHSVEVSAESLYEAAVLGLHVLKQDQWVGPLAPGLQVEIQVRHPSTVHSISIAQLRRWVEGVTASPDDVLRKRKLKSLLGG